MAIENTVDGAFGWAVNLGETSGKDFSDLGCSPRGFFTLDAQDCLLYLYRKLIGIAVGSPAAVTEIVESHLLIPIPKTYNRSSEEIPNSRHSSAIFSPCNNRPMNFSLSSMSPLSFHGIHSPPV